MKRQRLILFAASAALACFAAQPALAGGGGGMSHGGGGHGGSGHGGGIRFTGNRSFVSGVGGFGYGGGFYGCDTSELYRQLYNNLPFYALHPPVYYSCPVPRTYGYSPFAYPPGVMTPEIIGESQPLTIINPHVQSVPQQPVSAAKDRTAAVQAQPEPLVIINPFVVPTVAQNAR